MEKNIKPCSCCGQLRPYPTEPGKWQFSENVAYESYGYKVTWTDVEVKLPLIDDRDGQEGLRLWQHGKMVWWPSNCAWRKVEQT